MYYLRHLPTFATACVLLATGSVCLGNNASAEDFQTRIDELLQQNQSLQSSLAESNRTEKEASAQLAQVREKMEALGKHLLDGGDERLIQAAADLQLANERVRQLESTVTKLSSAVTGYIQQAVVSDPDARVRVETSLRELDALLGLRQKPRPDIRSGSLQKAQVVSLDPESGMLVLNLGESQGAKIGMTFQLLRGQLFYGRAILADVRKAVSGAFIEKLDNESESARPGDLAILETQPTGH